MQEKEEKNSNLLVLKLQPAIELRSLLTQKGLCIVTIFKN